MRQSSFGENKHLKLDDLLFYLRSRPIVDEIKKIHGPIKVLDAGCGYNPNLLARLAGMMDIESAVGVDLSINNNFSHPKIKIIESSLEDKLPLDSATFDAVVSTAVIEHLNNYRLALEEVYRVLKPGGTLLLTTPSPVLKPILEFLAFRLKIIDEHEIRDHKQYFGKNELAKILKEVGFKNVKVKSFQFGLNIFAVGLK